MDHDIDRHPQGGQEVADKMTWLLWHPQYAQDKAVVSSLDTHIGVET